MSSSSSKRRTRRVGDVVRARLVTRPDGVTVRVAPGRRGGRGAYVLTVAGLYTVDGRTMQVEA